MARITKKDALEFTIKNLDLRIEKAISLLYSRELNLKRETDTAIISVLNQEVKYLKDTIDGYENAQTKLRNNKELNKDDIKYILKGLNLRKSQLDRKLDDCRVVIARETQAMKNKKYKTDMYGGIGVVTQFNEKVSKEAIQHCERRIVNITRSKELCIKALGIFCEM